MHSIYTYIPETNCVPREYSVAAILLLLFMVLISLVSVFYYCYYRMLIQFITFYGSDINLTASKLATCDFMLFFYYMFYSMLSVSL